MNNRFHLLLRALTYILLVSSACGAEAQLGTYAREPREGCYEEHEDLVVPTTFCAWLFEHTEVFAFLSDGNGRYSPNRPSHLCVRNNGRKPCYVWGVQTGWTFGTPLVVEPGRTELSSLAIYSPLGKPLQSIQASFKVWVGPVPDHNKDRIDDPNGRHRQQDLEGLLDATRRDLPELTQLLEDLTKAAGETKNPDIRKLLDEIIQRLQDYLRAVLDAATGHGSSTGSELERLRASINERCKDLLSEIRRNSGQRNRKVAQPVQDTTRVVYGGRYDAGTERYRLADGQLIEEYVDEQSDTEPRIGYSTRIADTKGVAALLISLNTGIYLDSTDIPEGLGSALLQKNERARLTAETLCLDTILSWLPEKTLKELLPYINEDWYEQNVVHEELGTYLIKYAKNLPGLLNKIEQALSGKPLGNTTEDDAARVRQESSPATDRQLLGLAEKLSRIIGSMPSIVGSLPDLSAAPVRLRNQSMATQNANEAGRVAKLAEVKAASKSSSVDPRTSMQRSGLIAPGVQTNTVLTEQALSELIHHVEKQLDTPRQADITVSKPAGPATRLQALAALVKVTFSRDEIASSQNIAPDNLPSDASQIPAWGRPYVIAAIAQDWWPAGRAFTPTGRATWEFVAAILEKMPLATGPEAGTALSPSTANIEVAPRSSDAPTGLAIDARGLRVDRSAYIRLLDENGRVLYPDPGYVPGGTYLQEHGLAAYCSTAVQSNRAGRRPLTIKPMGVTGADFHLSASDAQRIIRANEEGRFLWRWAVVVLTD